VVIAGPLVSVLFERGAFGAADTRATALALAIYGAGLPAFVLQKVWQPLFYAREDTRRPFLYALAALAINAAAAVGLMPVAGFAAAALGTTLAGWGMLALLVRGAGGMGEAARPDARLWSRAWRIAAAAAAMGLVLWGAALGMADWLSAPALRYAALASLVGLGIATYFGTGFAIGAFRMAELRGALRRGG
jgi:putative peptidoglycan lipid II flippase